jgi:fumarylpyruvate hydrolase
MMNVTAQCLTQLSQPHTVSDYVIPPPAHASLPVSTGAQRFPICRIFCVGRDYAAHPRKMEKVPDREPHLG